MVKKKSSMKAPKLKWTFLCHCNNTSVGNYFSNILAIPVITWPVRSYGCRGLLLPTPRLIPLCLKASRNPGILNDQGTCSSGQV